jgi:hypothetical protein
MTDTGQCSDVPIGCPRIHSCPLVQRAPGLLTKPGPETGSEMGISGQEDARCLPEDLENNCSVSSSKHKGATKDRE